MSMLEAFSISFMLKKKKKKKNFITQKLWAIKPRLWHQIEFFSSGAKNPGVFCGSATTFH